MAGAAAASEGDAVKQRIQGLMGRVARVTVSDGRVILGQLYCIDASKNIVIKDAENWVSPEVEEKESPADRAKRWLGIIMVPGSHAVKVEIAASDDDGA